MVSEQVRRSSSRSLFSCKANKYLEGNSNIRQISSKGSRTHSPCLRRRTAHSLRKQLLLTTADQLCAEAELQGARPGSQHRTPLTSVAPTTVCEKAGVSS